MKIIILLLYSLLIMPFVLSSSIQMQSSSISYSVNDEIIINAYIDAPEIVGYEFDLSYDNSLVSFNSITYLDNEGNTASSPDYITITPTITTGIIEGIASATTKPLADTEGVYVQLRFTALASGIAEFIPSNMIITNLTTGNNSYPNTFKTSSSVSIIAEGITYGTPLNVPSTSEINKLINITYPLNTLISYPNGVETPPPGMFTGINYWLDDGNIKTPLIFSNNLITLKILAGTTYQLIQEVKTPVLVINNEFDDGNYANKEFSIISEDDFLGVYGKISLSTAYPHIWLFQIIDSEEVIKNQENNLLLNGNYASFENIIVDSNTQHFILKANLTCENNWSDWSSWSTCTDNSQSRTQSDNNYCVSPYFKQEIQDCTTSSSSSSGGGGGSSSGEDNSGIGIASEITKTTNYRGAITETIINFIGFEEDTFNIYYQDISLDFGLSYKGFVLSSEVTNDKILGIKIIFEINDYWMKSNNIKEIEVYKKSENDWEKVSVIEQDKEYIISTNSLGTYAIIGIQESETQIPGEIISGNDDKTGVEKVRGKILDITSFIPLGIFIFVAIMFIISAVVISTRHPKIYDYPKEVPKTDIKKVLDYVKKAKSEGIDEEIIRINLLKVGWSVSIVEKVMAIKEINSSVQKMREE